MIIGTTTQYPVVFAIALLNWQVVDAGNPPPHESVFVELPILIAIGTEPVAGIIMPSAPQT